MPDDAEERRRMARERYAKEISDTKAALQAQRDFFNDPAAMESAERLLRREIEGGNYPWVNLDGLEIGPETIALIPGELAILHRIIPISLREGRFHFAIDGSVPKSLETLRKMLGEPLGNLELWPSNADAVRIDRALEKYYYP